MTVRCIVDTDLGMGTPGADPEDGCAVLFALASRGVSLEALTLVQGNVPISHSWPNARHLLALADRRDVPVVAGADRALAPDRRPLQTAWLQAREGAPHHPAGTSATDGHTDGHSDGDGDVPSDAAADHIRHAVLAAPGELTIVAIGPLTNVARALEADPEVAGAIGHLVVMGGTVAVPGNVTPAAEFNCWMDPEAAAVVFASSVRTTMVGLDVCHRTAFTRADAEALGHDGTARGRFVADASLAWMEVRQAIGQGQDDLHLYDTLAMAVAVEPALVTTEQAVVEVETSTGPAQGMTVTHTDPVLGPMLTGGRAPDVAVAVDVDVERFQSLVDARLLGR